MTERLRHPLTTLALAGGAVLLAGTAWGQDDGRAATRSLNAGPAQSTLPTRPEARTALPSAGVAPTSRPRPRTLEQAFAEAAPSEAPEPPAGRVTLAPGETEPPPIPVTLGYYVRGDVDCERAWPGDGDLAWMTPTAFTIDFGGCEPGQFLQTGPNSWREDQRCVTESGGDAGGYSVTYEVIETGVVKRTARLALDDSVEADVWRHCPVETVAENARFRSGT